jgi:hypothetical protein
MQDGNINKDIEKLEGNQKEIQELESITDIKIALKKFKGKCQWVKDKVR